MSANKYMYIFFTANIYTMGGMQTYVLSKARYLRQENWDVRVVYGGYQQKKPLFIELNQYCKGGFIEVSYSPMILPNKMVNNCISQMLKHIGDTERFEKIIIESHDDKTSQWAEIIASRINAKHIIVPLDEMYRNPNQTYDKQIEFYYYKLGRKELFGTYVLDRLFDGYYEIEEKDKQRFLFNEDPVQDIENSKLNCIKRKDYNIAYIGRLSKSYVLSVFQGVRKFAEKHNNEDILFVIVGDTSQLHGNVKGYFEKLQNLQVLELGEMVPIPKKLFSVVDVVIANAGCARCSAMAGALTIVANPEYCQSIGLLGYDTSQPTYWDGQSKKCDFDEALEDTLIKKTYKGKKFAFVDYSVEECIKQNFELINNSEKKLEYYDITKLIGDGTTLGIADKLKIFSAKKTPNILAQLISWRRYARKE